MATAAQIPLQEYLHTAYDGLEPEYLSGEIVARTVPSKEHAAAQFRLAGVLHSRAPRGRLLGHTELRLQTGESRVRIADLALYIDDEPNQTAPSNPPQVVAEILSPDDRMSEVLDKLDEYERWGVQQIWLIDPHRRQFSTFHGGRLYPADALAISELGVTVAQEDLF